MADERTPRNAAGPFYVGKDECISCGAPEAEARDLMSYDEEHSSCFFERQPTTPDEEYRAIRAVWASCCGAVRYGGTDRKVMARLESLERGRVASAVTFAADSSEFAPDVLRRIGANMVAAYVGLTASEVTSANRGDSSWLIEERQNDVFCLRRLNDDEVTGLVESNVWPPDFDSYEALLRLGLDTASPPRPARRQTVSECVT